MFHLREGAKRPGTQTDIAVMANDDVIQHRHIEQSTRLDGLCCHRHILGAWLRVAAGMIVSQKDLTGVPTNGHLEQF